LLLLGEDLARKNRGGRGTFLKVNLTQNDMTMSGEEDDDLEFYSNN